MADESLLTAARRVVRFFGIDMNKGGLITTETEVAMLTLDKQVQRAVQEIKAEGSIKITENYHTG
jgi:hypothetical protein